MDDDDDDDDDEVLYSAVTPCCCSMLGALARVVSFEAQPAAANGRYLVCKLIIRHYPTINISRGNDYANSNLIFSKNNRTIGLPFSI